MNRKQRRAAQSGQAGDPASSLAAARQLLQQGALRPAESVLQRALARTPADTALLTEIAVLQAHLNEPRSARAHIERALALAADDPAVLQAAAEIFVTAGAYGEAELMLRRCTACQPDALGALANLGSVLFSQGKFAEAQDAFTATLARAPHHATTHKNLGAAQRALGALPDALASYRAAIALQPDLAEAHRDLGLLLLQMGGWREGFAEYEWRWRAATVGAPPLPGPRWTGEPLQGRRILLHFEQGFGDTIQFLRYVPMVAACGGHVALCVQPSLAGLAASVDGVGEIVPAGALPPHDCHAFLLSLPHLLDAGPLPAPAPYVSVPAQRLAHWRGALPPGEALRVGLVWAGHPGHENDRQRSLDPAMLATLTDTPSIRFYSLQPGHVPPAPMADLGPDLTDFTETAGALEQLDLLITVDTAVAHLAGALGRPVWLLLPFVADWRWLVGRADSPWYPSARLFRQPSPGDWGSVMATVRDALTALTRR